jgi:hypothetical protein
MPPFVIARNALAGLQRRNSIEALILILNYSIIEAAIGAVLRTG